MSPKRAFSAASPFADVTKTRHQPPSWIAKHTAPKVDIHSLRPAPLPREFISSLTDDRRVDPPPSITAPIAVDGPPSEPKPHSLPVPIERAAAPPAPANRTSHHPNRESSAPLATQLLQQELERVSAEANEALGRALTDLATARALVHQSSVNQLVELATTIARRVIAVELSTNPDVVRQLVDEGMRALELQDRLTIRIGPAFEEMRDVLLQDLSDHVGHLSVVVDTTLSDFGCVVETEHGWVDESLEARLATLLQELRAETDAA